MPPVKQSYTIIKGGVSMSAFKSEDEKEHVMHQLVLKDLPVDMANFFVFTDDITTEDVFEFHYLASEDFYIKMFRYVFKLLQESVKRDRFEKIAGSLLQRIYLDEFIYSRRINKRNKSNKDMIISVFIENLLTYLAMSSEIKALLYTITMIGDCENITKTAVKGIVTKDKVFATEMVIKELTTSYVLSTQDILDIMYTRFEYSTDEDMVELLKEIFFNDEEVLNFLIAVSEKFSYNSNRKRTKVVCEYRGKKNRFYKFLRRYLSETLMPKMERDIYDFVDTSYYRYINEKDVYRSDIYLRINEWLGSQERLDSMVNRFHLEGHEDEEFMINEEQHLAISCDAEGIRYKYGLLDLDNIELLVRVFNLNRFNFLRHRKDKFEIRDILNECDESNMNIILAGLSDDVYNFLFNYE